MATILYSIADSIELGLSDESFIQLIKFVIDSKNMIELINIIETFIPNNDDINFREFVKLTELICIKTFNATNDELKWYTDTSSEQSEEFYGNYNPYRYTRLCKIVKIILEKMFSYNVLELDEDVNHTMNILMSYYIQVKGSYNLVLLLNFNKRIVDWLNKLKYLNFLKVTDMVSILNEHSHYDNIIYIYDNYNSTHKIYSIEDLNKFKEHPQYLLIIKHFNFTLTYNKKKPSYIVSYFLTEMKRAIINSDAICDILDDILDDFGLAKSIFFDYGGFTYLMKFPFEQLKKYANKIIETFPLCIHDENFFNSLIYIKKYLYIDYTLWLKYLVIDNGVDVNKLSNIFDVFFESCDIYYNIDPSLEIQYLNIDNVRILKELGGYQEFKVKDYKKHDIDVLTTRDSKFKIVFDILTN